jgi:hypothetical protein
MQPLTLRIAVTGPRDIAIEDQDALQVQVEALLRRIAAKMGGFEPRLVTGLADGADRIAARAALAVGLEVDALLPMPQSMYRTDFDHASAAEFDALTALPAVSVRELSLPADVESVAAAEPGPDRDACYSHLSERLRDTSNLMLALWDGEDNGLLGGTADTLLRFLGAASGPALDREPVARPRSADGTLTKTSRMAYWIPTGRGGANVEDTGGYLAIGADGELLTVGDLPPAGALAELEELWNYAEDAQANVDPAAHPWGLLSDDLCALRPEIEDELRCLDTEYRRADLLAVHHQALSERLFKAFSLMAGMMGLLFLTYAKIYPGKLFLAGYLALFMAGVVLFWLAGRGRWFTRHLMYRAIAESLRTRFFLTVAGVEAPVIERRLMRLLGVEKITGFSWIDHVLRASVPLAPVTPSDEKASAAWVASAWLKDQRDYFNRKSHTLHHAHHQLERIKQGILAGMVIAIFSLILFKQPLTDTMLMGLSMKTLIVFLLGLIPFWLGVWEIHQGKMATKELGWQYRNQLEHLEEALGDLGRDDRSAHSAAVLEDVAERLLADTYLWTVQRYHREHEPPAAG